jgi:hypothetical protein
MTQSTTNSPIRISSNNIVGLEMESFGVVRDGALISTQQQIDFYDKSLYWHQDGPSTNLKHNVLPESFPQPTPSAAYFVTEKWDLIHNIPCKIAEIGEDYIIMDCVIRTEPIELQLRKFQKIDFENAKELRQGDMMLIRIMKRPGKSVITIETAKNMHYDRYFIISDEELDDISAGNLFV